MKEKNVQVIEGEVITEGVKSNKKKKALVITGAIATVVTGAVVAYKKLTGSKNNSETNTTNE